MKTFRVSFAVAEEKLNTIVSLLAGEVSGFHVVDETVKVNRRNEALAKVKKTPFKITKPIQEWPTSKVVLKAIEEHGPLTGGDAALHLVSEGYRGSGAYILLKKLVEAGIVSTYQDEQNKRRHFIKRSIQNAE